MNRSKHFFGQALQGLYTAREIDQLWEHTAQAITGRNRLERIFSGEEPSIEKIQKIVQRLQQHEPIQYILEQAYFYGRTFFVQQGVLIPRPETEELTQLALQMIRTKNYKSCWDLCTGSGVIAITISLETAQKTAVLAADISPQALMIAQENQQRLGSSVTFVQADVLQADMAGTVDCIIANPPYIPLEERAQIARNVLAYEPHLALFVPDDQPLVFYAAILQQAVRAQAKMVLFEIHEKAADAMMDLAKKYGFLAYLCKDLQGKDRFLLGERFF